MFHFWTRCGHLFVVMSTAKQLLKSAKAALDSGDPDAALSICRDVLKLDKNNYMAYVIAGVAAKKTGNATHAAQVGLLGE